MLTDWRKSAEGQWSSISEEWESERERPTFMGEKWESKVKAVEMNLGTTRAKFESGLASLTVVSLEAAAQARRGR
jgi:hypothetical protein